MVLVVAGYVLGLGKFHVGHQMIHGLCQLIVRLKEHIQFDGDHGAVPVCLSFVFISWINVWLK